MQTNWIVTLKKQSHLDTTRVLTTLDKVPEVVAGLLTRYDEFNENDSITVTPTDIVHHE